MSHNALAATLIASLVVLSAGMVPVRAQQTAALQAPSLEGAWSGSGTVSLSSGAREQARCRASFRRQGGDRYGMNAVCATASARVAQTAELTRVSANKFSGSFYNAEYGVSGSIVVTVRGSSLSASLNGGGSSAVIHMSR